MILLALFLVSFVTLPVTKLTEDNISGTLKNNEWVFVKYYAPWCGHCKQLAPHYEKLAQSASDLNVVIAEVDCTDEEDICQEAGIKGYPTLMIFHNSQPTKYSGKPTELDMLKFLKKITGKSLTHVGSLEALTKLVSESFVIAYLPDAESDDFQQFKVSSTAGTVSFYYVTDSSLMLHLTDSPSTMLYYRNMDNKTIPYTGDLLLSVEIDEFVNVNFMPGVVWLSRENSEHLFIADNRVLIVMVNTTEEPIPHLEEMMLEAFESAKGKVKTCILDVTNNDFEAVVEFFGLPQAPSFGGVFLGESFERYHPEDYAINQANLVDFITKMVNGEAKRHIKRQEVPEDWDKFPVKQLTLYNFEDVALDQSKHVFVMFYAPWCGHCKKLMPEWEKLAMHFEANSEVLIAKTDGTKNEYEFQIEGFPTLLFYPKGSKDMNSYTVYKESRKLADLIAFVELSLSGPRESQESAPSEEL